MGVYDCDCINNLEYERSKRREKLFHITPQKQNRCILTEFAPEEVAADMASTSPFVIETWCSLLKGLNRAGYIICKKI